jgi:uncharacterized 2Fe-2S/4Fe-4S cluster protein (DUF4445 family)
VEAGTSLLQAAAQAGLLLEAPCGGGGTCGKCRVRLRSGRASADGSAHRLSADELAGGWRLACATPVEEALEVEVPSTTLLPRLGAILVDGDPVAVRHDPRPPGHLGVAFDLGTTSVAGTLFDLHTGLERATRAAMNRQIALGDDVISRIAAVRADAENLATLQRLAVATLSGILSDLCGACQERPDAVRELVVAGNTTMQHLLLGLDPSPLGESPFTPAFTDAQTVPAAGLGLQTHPDATLTVFPQLGGFVGGDTVAGMLAAHFDAFPHPVLLVDVGTNGELALLHGGRIYAASAAAGPAFEGARIRQGMRASDGAIDAVTVDGGALHTHVIGGGDATGLCGSALVDAVAELLRVGLIAPDGAFVVSSSSARVHAGPDAPASGLAARLRSSASGPQFLLDPGGSCSCSAVWLTQRDIRELQLASGAIRAGIETLLRRAGLAADDLGALLLAGGFGNTIRVRNAVRIGLLPSLADGAIRFIGNASLTGAKRALLARSELERARALRDLATHVDLSAEPGFSECFMERMLFPEP